MTIDNELPKLVRTAPDRIWLQVGEDADCDAAFPGDEATWCRDHIFDSDVEYVRADRAQWPAPRPMSEAPRDKPVLAWWPTGKQWCQSWYWPAGRRWECSLSDVDDPQPTCWLPMVDDPQPTHWLPMPPAPTEQETTK